MSPRTREISFDGLESSDRWPLYVCLCPVLSSWYGVVDIKLLEFLPVFAREARRTLRK